MSEDQAERRELTALRAEIAARLRPVCDHWPAELFEGMVDGLAEITLKYDAGGKLSQGYDPRITERLIDDMKDAVRRSMGSREK